MGCEDKNKRSLYTLACILSNWVNFAELNTIVHSGQKTIASSATTCTMIQKILILIIPISIWGSRREYKNSVLVIYHLRENGMETR